MTTYLLKLFVGIAFCSAIFFSPIVSAQTQDPSGYKISATGFFENKGQLSDQNHKPNPAVKYLFCSPGFNVQLRQTGFSYDTYTDTPDSATTQNAIVLPKGRKLPQSFSRHYNRVDIELLGSNPNVQLIAEGKSKAYYNYITAGTPQGGVSDVHYYQKIIYKNIYPDIDLEFFAPTTKQNSIPVEYQFIVHPGANPANIKLAYKGANKVNLDEGKLIVSVDAGDFNESIPSSYLKATGQAVKVSYAVLGSNVFTFSLPKNMIVTSDLVIDPVPNLVWGTYYGETGDDEGYGITVDSKDNVCVTGLTSSTSNIATTGAYQATNGGGYDAFAAKFNSGGTSLLWATYYGGPGTDYGYAIALDAGNNVYITGSTTSSSGIATTGAYQTTYAGGTYDGDAFAAKFDSSGKSLLWGTYFGGPEDDYGDGIAVDANDDVYITGETESSSGIATAGAYQTVYGGDGDVLIAKFNPVLSGSAQLLWATYYGGAGDDYGYGLALDANDNIYITGGTTSTSGIATSGTYNTTCGAHGNAFIGKFNPTLSGTAQLAWGTYYGGQGSSQGGDFAYGITLDASDNIYITGQAGSTTGIATPDAYDTSYGKQGVTTFWDAFVAEFNPTLSSSAQLVWGTYFGESNCSTGGPPPIPPQFDGYAIAVDACANVYITGEVQENQCSATGMVTTNAYQTTIGSDEYCYVAKFNPTLSSPNQLVWGTYYGGTGLNYNDQGWGIALDTSNNVYITGLTQSSNGIATTGAYQTTFGGSEDVFVAKFDSSGSCSSCLTPRAAGTIASDNGINICTGGGGSYTYTIPAIIYATGYTWTLPAGASITAGANTDSITVSYAGVSVTGQQSITVFGTNSCGNGITSAAFTVDIDSILTITATPNPDSYCSGGSSILTASGGTTYIWSPSTGLSATTGSSVTANPTVTTTYTVNGMSSGGCSGSTMVTVIVDSTLVITASPNPVSYCPGGSSTLTASGGKTYTWSPSTDLSATTGSSVMADPTITTTYIVTGTNSSGCSTTDTVTVTVDSILTITATANPSTYCSGGSTILTASGASTYTWSPSTNLSSTTGSTVTANPTVTTVYTVTGSSNGCSGDTNVTITVIGSPNKPTFYQHGDTLTSSAVNDNQWYRDDTLLKGDTSQNLIITIPGEYWVVVENEANGCSTASDSVTTTGINQLSVINYQLSVYPNPFNNNVFIKISSSEQDVKDWAMQLTDVLGRTLYSMSSLNYINEIDLSGLPGGMYFITVINKMGRDIVPVVKQ